MPKHAINEAGLCNFRDKLYFKDSDLHKINFLIQFGKKTEK